MAGGRVTVGSAQLPCCFLGLQFLGGERMSPCSVQQPCVRIVLPQAAWSHILPERPQHGVGGCIAGHCRQRGVLLRLRLLLRALTAATTPATPAASLMQRLQATSTTAAAAPMALSASLLLQRLQTATIAAAEPASLLLLAATPTPTAASLSLSVVTTAIATAAVAAAAESPAASLRNPRHRCHAAEPWLHSAPDGAVLRICQAKRNRKDTKSKFLSQ